MEPIHGDDDEPIALAPATPPIPVDRALPWKLIPARLFLHSGVFIGVLLTLLHVGSSLDNKPEGPRLEGMSTWVYVTWSACGLASFPMVCAAYFIVRIGSGNWRYFALRVETVSNLLAVFVLVAYAYSAALVGYVFWHHQSTLAWSLLVSMILFLAWVVINDFLAARVLSDRALALRHENDWGDDGSR